MATKAENLDALTVEELKQLASDYDVQLTSSTKAEIVEELSSSRSVTAEAIQARVDEKNAGDGASEEDTEADEVDHGSVDGEGTEATPLDALDPTERVEGRTSDAASRREGVTASEVPPDITDGLKRSDAGPDQYPFPPGGDVEIATVDPGSGEDEVPPVILAGFFVRLGEHDSVPERFWGHLAVVQTSPWKNVPFTDDARETIHGYYFNEDEDFVVQTRDEASARLEVPVEAFSQYGQARADLMNFA